jgi:hypothetical protein
MKCCDGTDVAGAMGLILLDLDKSILGSVVSYSRFRAAAFVVTSVCRAAPRAP